MEYILKTQNLKKKYGNFLALDNLNIHIPKGSIYGIIGKNGAGKTTLIRLICGLQKPTNGNFYLLGIKHNDKKISTVRKKIGAVIETPSIFLDLTARENLIMQYDIIGNKNYEEIEEILKIVGLEKAEKKKAKNFSLGMRQRLGIAIALCGNPEFLILDEPNNGLDPEGIVDIRNLLIKLNKEKNITILISSHILDELSKIATHYGFVKDGKIIKEISAADFEKECHVLSKIEVDNQGLEKILISENYDYKMLNETSAEIYGHLKVTPLVLKLHKENINVLRLNEQEETLENYFFTLLGGDDND